MPTSKMKLNKRISRAGIKMRRLFFVRLFVCDRCAKGEEGIGLSALFSLARE